MIEIKIVAHSPAEMRALRPLIEAIAAVADARDEAEKLYRVQWDSGEVGIGAPTPNVISDKSQPEGPLDNKAEEPEPEEKPKRGRRKKAEAEAEAEPEIRANPENRVDPEQEEAGADDEQDAADEAAEVPPVETRPLSHDDVRHALGRYVTAFGMAAAQEDGPALIKLVCGDKAAKVSDIPDDQAVLRKVVSGVDEMIAKNPYKRAAVGG